MKSVLLSIFVLLLSGCASAPSSIAPVAGESLHALKSERIAVNYNLAESRINYHETLYRLVFLENKSSSQDFSGFWSPDADLSSYVVARLRGQGFTADSVFEVTDRSVLESAASAWSKSAIAASEKTNPTIPSAKLLPKDEFFLSPPVDDKLRALIATLRDKGYRYLVHLTAMDVLGNAPGYGLVIVSAEPYVRMIDLKSEKVIWGTKIRHIEAYQLGGDLKALETDNMKKTRAGLEAGISKLDFVSLWGLPSAK